MFIYCAKKQVNIKIVINEERGKMEATKILSPKLDVVFHMLFGVQENEKITKGLINGVIQEKVESIKLGETPYLWGTHAEVV